jgi:class 3 adenylate cyclase/alpha-beta hydrolase superfamily lysophospholipase
MAIPQTRFARSGDVNIAYQVIGEGSLDLVLVLGFATHIEVLWELPAYARIIERLTSFARVIVFDKRGMGLSDRPSVLSTFEQQHDDVRAVLDAVGAKRPVLFGFTEGGPMCLLFAATYPERTGAMVLLSSYAKFGRTTEYPFGPTRDIEEKLVEKIAAQWGREPFLVQAQAPSRAGDLAFEQWLWKLQRFSQSPGAALSWYKLTTEIDVRHVLPVIGVPTLILHRAGDRIVDVGHSRFMAQQIRGAKYVELPGNDNFPGSGDTEAMLDEVEEFLTGIRPAAVHDRVLATVMVTDIVGSTETAAKLGDRRWRSLLEAHHGAVRTELGRFAGREVDTAGDGFLATFDGPARAIRCASAIAAGVRTLGLDVRIGLHSGECEVIGGKIGGIAVHIAARVAAQATAHEILVTSTVKDLVVGSEIRFAERGSTKLKGVPDQWRVFAVEPRSVKG